ncbi:MAG: LysR family transcriptional regulator [Candidimonas sp.]|nr:MAG: LysR family transcriptional regulator [Candidimonas sp.]
MLQIQDADLRALRIFTTVVRSGGFTAAQPVLGLGASAISEYMSRLETRLGVRLCERGRAGFRLTEEGKLAFDAAQRLLSNVEEFRLNVSSLSNTLRGELRLGLIDNILTDPRSPLPKAVRKFSRRSDQIQIHIEINLPHILEQDMLDGRLHVAIAPSPQRIRGLDYLRLTDEEHGLYCGSEHPLFGQGKVSLREIQRARVISRGYLRGKDLRLIKVKSAAAIADNVEARLLLLLTGEYIGFLPRHYAERWVSSGQLRHLLPDEIVYRVPFYLIRRSRDSHWHSLSVFIQDVFDALPAAALTQS